MLERTNGQFNSDEEQQIINGVDRFYAENFFALNILKELQDKEIETQPVLFKRRSFKAYIIEEIFEDSKQPSILLQMRNSDNLNWKRGESIFKSEGLNPKVGDIIVLIWGFMSQRRSNDFKIISFT